MLSCKGLIALASVVVPLFGTGSPVTAQSLPGGIPMPPATASVAPRYVFGSLQADPVHSVVIRACSSPQEIFVRSDHVATFQRTGMAAKLVVTRGETRALYSVRVASDRAVGVCFF